MSSTNRFSVLMDKPKLNKKEQNTNGKEVIKTTQENKLNIFKNDNQQIIQKNNYIENKYQNDFRRKQEYDKRRLNTEQDKIKSAKEIEIKILTNLDNFPQLKSSSIKKTQGENNNNNYCNKLLNIIDSSSIKNKTTLCCSGSGDTDDDENIPEGCVCIKLDKKENNFKWITKNGVINDNVSNKETYKSLKDDYDNPYNIMSRLVKLNKIRRNDYIRKWGLDEYEYMFMFPNYNYEYYDTVDELYDSDFDKNNNSLFIEDYVYNE
jgi:hypothetical protein